MKIDELRKLSGIKTLDENKKEYADTDEIFDGMLTDKKVHKSFKPVLKALKLSSNNPKFLISRLEDIVKELKRIK